MQLIVALVLINVVIAVLLDEFSKAAASKAAEVVGGGGEVIRLFVFATSPCGY
jgi:hypothetical protein